jgi:hypothetical protein
MTPNFSQHRGHAAPLGERHRSIQRLGARITPDADNPPPPRPTANRATRSSAARSHARRGRLPEGPSDQQAAKTTRHHKSQHDRQPRGVDCLTGRHTSDRPAAKNVPSKQHGPRHSGTGPNGAPSSSRPAGADGPARTEADRLEHVQGKGRERHHDHLHSDLYVRRGRARCHARARDLHRQRPRSYGDARTWSGSRTKAQADLPTPKSRPLPADAARAAPTPGTARDRALTLVIT